MFKKTIKDKSIFKKIKFKIDIINIFSFLTKIQTLKIIKKNKYLNKLLGINLETYIIFSELQKNFLNYENYNDIYNHLIKKLPNKKFIFKEDLKNHIIRFLLDNKQYYFKKINSNYLDEHMESILQIIQLKNGNIASSSLDKMIKIWDINNLKLLYTLKGHKDDVSCIIQDNLKENILYSGSDDKTIKIWDLIKKVCLKTFNAHNDIIYKILIIKNNNYLISTSEDCEIHIYEINEILNLKNKENKYFKNIKNHQSAVTCLLEIDNNLFKFLVSGSCDETINIYNLNNFNLINTLKGHKGTVFCLLNKDNNLLSGSEDKSIKIWDLKDFNCIYTFKNAHQNDISCLILDRLDNNYFYSSSYDEKIIKWDLKNRKKKYLLIGQFSPINSLIMLDNYNLCSGSKNGIIKIWNINFYKDRLNKINDIDNFTNLNKNGNIIYNSILIK